jgi:hypothetical protein
LEKCVKVLRMNNKLLAVAAFVGIGVLAVGAYLFTRQPNSVTNTSQTTDSMVETSDANSFSGTFSDLLARGQSYTCTFSESDNDGNTTKGNVYVAAGGDRFNGEFELVQPTGTLQSYIIRDGEYNYIWTAGQSEGIKTKINPEDASLFGDSEETPVDENEPVDFDCAPWTVDNSKFVPPANVSFIDFSDTMAEMENVMEENEIDCSVCDQIPAGESRDQCLQSLGC